MELEGRFDSGPMRWALPLLPSLRGRGPTRLTECNIPPNRKQVNDMATATKKKSTVLVIHPDGTHHKRTTITGRDYRWAIVQETEETAYTQLVTPERQAFAEESLAKAKEFLAKLEAGEYVVERRDGFGDNERVYARAGGESVYVHTVDLGAFNEARTRELVITDVLPSVRKRIAEWTGVVIGYIDIMTKLEGQPPRYTYKVIGYRSDRAAAESEAERGNRRTPQHLRSAVQWLVTVTHTVPEGQTVKQYLDGLKVPF